MLYPLFPPASAWWPRGGALRVLSGTWLLMAFILATVYRSNLKAMIIIPKFRLPFNSLEEMLETDIPCFVPLGGLIHQLMQVWCVPAVRWWKCVQTEFFASS